MKIQLKGVKAVLTLTFKTRGRLASLKKATARGASEPCGKGNYPKKDHYRITVSAFQMRRYYLSCPPFSETEGVFSPQESTGK